VTFLDQQLGVKDEVTFGTPVTVDRFFEFESESIKENHARTEGDPLRPGTYFKRSDRFTPYFAGASGTIEMAMLSKGFGWWVKHLMGASATSGPTDSVYTHAGTCGPLLGDFFTLQIVRPFNPSSTAQAFTYSGCKVPKWGIANSVDGNLMLSVDIDAAVRTTATAVASASYPTAQEPLTWAGGTFTIAGTTVPVTEIAFEVDNGLNVDRRYINGSTTKKEPVGDGRSGSFSMTADFDALTQINRVASTSASGALGKLVCTWNAPTLAGVSAYPAVVVTIETGRFDEFEATNAGRGEGISQSLSGAIAFDGTNSAVKLDVKNTDSTA
jgi:hypothetical protein